MGDNGYDNEETAALFVSAQKKKKAEEEARRRAAEEQARREAAEAEVRRMEMEVEERRRKAEEERIALEKAEAEKAEKAAQAAKEAKTAKPAAAEQKPAAPTAPSAPKAPGAGNPKMPLFIGIGVAAVAVIGIAIFAMTSGGGAPKEENKQEASAEEDSKAAEEMVEEDEEDFEELSAGERAEYMPSDPDFQFPVGYDSAWVSDITESRKDNELHLEMTPAADGIDSCVMILKPAEFSEGVVLSKGYLAEVKATDIAKFLSQAAADQVSDRYGEVELVEDQLTTFGDKPNSERYLYLGTYGLGEDTVIAAYSWLMPNTEGKYYVASAIGDAKLDGDVEGLGAMGAFLSNANEASCLKVPGFDPPESTELNSRFEVEACHMAIPVPEGRFEYCPDSGDFDIWTDQNAASIMVSVIELENLKAEEADTWRDKALESFKVMSSADDGGIMAVPNVAPNVESRTFEDDTIVEKAIAGYRANYSVVIGGVNYWERDYVAYWKDEQTGKGNAIIVCTLAPKANRDIYQELFDKVIDGLEDY